MNLPQFRTRWSLLVCMTASSSLQAPRRLRPQARNILLQVEEEVIISRGECHAEEEHQNEKRNLTTHKAIHNSQATQTPPKFPTEESTVEGSEKRRNNQNGEEEGMPYGLSTFMPRS
ncbi:hypothetical protein Taro_035159 [Colocasia esculenta]|uniref:Uncharacterized protein n=1 Tax=Colocasia esculenta TaxID=4460 RepID=A0A843VTJ5_COLES|nr:hypothetical protein [Colocasia esculenta]